MESQTQVTNFFGNVSDEYLNKQYFSGKRTFINVRHNLVVQKLVELFPIMEDRYSVKILDAGCGPGALSKALIDLGFNVYSMDIAEGMLNTARNLIGSEGKFTQGSIEDVPFADDQFDVVVSCGVIEYLPQYYKAFAEFIRVLKTDGLLLTPSTNTYAIAGWTYPLMEKLKHVGLVQKLFNVRPRDFVLTYHDSEEMKNTLKHFGQNILDVEYFYHLPYPRPVDIILGKLSQYTEKFLTSKLNRSRMVSMLLAEGFLIISRKHI